MEAFPFQSNFTGFDETGNPVFDRAVGAEFIRAREKLFFTNGIFAAPSDNFQVMNGTGLQIIVRPGTCFIEGVTGIEIEETVLEIATAAELSARTDIVVLRCDFVNRWIELAVKTGTKELTRTGNIYELKIAEITVPKMALEISQSNILDTRLSAECGVVATIPNHVDTSTIFNQYLEKWKEISAVMSQNASQFSTGFNMYGVANGVDNYTVTIDGAMVVDGANFKIKFMNASSGAQPTLNINALGAKPIKRMNGTIPKIVAGSYLNLIYSESAGAFYPAGEGLGGTATPAQVFAGYTFTNDDGIQEGAAILGDAAANQVLKGAKFSSNKAGTNVAGTIPSKGAATITPGTTNKTIEAGQYLSGTQTIVGSANLKPENIKQGVNIMGIIGSLSSLLAKSSPQKSITKNISKNSGDTINIQGEIIAVLWRMQYSSMTNMTAAFWFPGLGYCQGRTDTFKQDTALSITMENIFTFTLNDKRDTLTITNNSSNYTCYDVSVIYKLLS